MNTLPKTMWIEVDDHEYKFHTYERIFDDVVCDTITVPLRKEEQFIKYKNELVKRGYVITEDQTIKNKTMSIFVGKYEYAITTNEIICASVISRTILIPFFEFEKLDKYKNELLRRGYVITEDQSSSEDNGDPWDLLGIEE